MIQIRSLTRRFGNVLALDQLSFEVAPGAVTGFLGPNGAGKTTTLRILLGLDNASSGEALVDGQRFRELPAPMRVLGAHLDPRSAHPGRTAFQHLYGLALTHRISSFRVEEVLDEVGLTDVARKRVAGFSLGMRQRLGIAAAMLGDPEVLVFDEPINGLDPDGVRWFRGLTQDLAREGRTVFLSSHLLSELEQTVEHVVVIGKGKLLTAAPLSELRALATMTTHVSTPTPSKLASLFPDAARYSGADVTIEGFTAAEVGKSAMDAGIELHELRSDSPSLESAYRALTGDSVEYRAAR